MSVYEIITNRIIEALEKGVIPWRKPWIGGGIARNFITKKPYRGINPFILSLYDFSCEYWLTMKQVNDLGGRVRKGEKSALVVFWKWIDIQEEKSNGVAATKEIPFLRYYHVFNIEHWGIHCGICGGVFVCAEVVSGGDGDDLRVFGAAVWRDINHCGGVRVHRGTIAGVGRAAVCRGYSAVFAAIWSA